MQAAGRRIAQDFVHDAKRVAVGLQRRRHFITEQYQLHVTLAAHGEIAFAILRRFDGPERRQHALGLRDRAEGLADPGQRLRRIEFASHQQHRVIGLVVGMVEGLQVLDADVLDVAAVADGGTAVGMPVVGHAAHALEQHVEGIVLAALVLVAHHGHFGIEILAGDEGMRHAVRFHRQRPFQVVVLGLEDFVVVGAVFRSGAVELHAARRELLRDRLVLRRTLEHHVLQQVRHAGLAVVFVARADQIGDVDGHGGLGGVRKQQHFQAVRELVFGDAFDRRALDDAGRQGLRPGARHEGQAAQRDARAGQVADTAIFHGFTQSLTKR